MSDMVHPRRREDLILREVEHELVVYDPLSDRICLLNRSAAAVLVLCDGTRTVADIAAEICAAFLIDAETARSDVERVLADLAGQRIFAA